MNRFHRRLLLSALILPLFPGALAAQSSLPFELRTVGTFGAAARDGALAAAEALPDATSVGASGLSLDASILDPMWPGPLAQLFATHYFRTRVVRERNANGDPGLRWTQTGNSGALGGGFIGTSVGALVPGAQELDFAIPAAAGLTGEVVIDWSAFASRAATIDVTIDVDGDGVADATLGATNERLVLPVTGGVRGLQVRLRQNTVLANGAPGSIGTHLGIWFVPARPASTCTAGAAPIACGPQLSGRIGRNGAGADAIELQLSGAPANAFVVLAIGPELATPIVVNGALCPWIVDTVATDFTIAMGAAVEFSYAVGSARGIDLRLQAAVLQRRIDVSNAVTLRCQ